MIGRRRRRHGSDATPEGAAADPADAQTDTAPAEAGDDRPAGPYDIGDLAPETARKGRIDLGGMLVPAVQGMKLQFRIDEKSGKSGRVTVVAQDAAVELIAIAAPRNSGMWEQTRFGIIEDSKRRGGKAEEADGPFGTELRVLLPATNTEGKRGVQASRVAGIDGPRWMLRATFIGGATTDASAFARMVEVVRGVVVVRGDRPMAPGDVIALTPPARPEEAPAEQSPGGGEPGVG